MTLGPSFYATPRRDFFTYYRTGDFVIIRMENNGVSYIGGIGDVVFRTFEDNELILREVIHAPYLRLNLISGGKLDEEGYTSQLGRGWQKLTKGPLVIIRGKRCCKLYSM